MKEEIKAGDIVYLKSGGPKMTVGAIDEGREIAECTWFQKNLVENESFYVATLTKKDPNPTHIKPRPEGTEIAADGGRPIAEIEDEPNR